MHKNPNIIYKFLILALIFCFVQLEQSHAQDDRQDGLFNLQNEASVADRLHLADSLFSNKKYTDAYIIYNDLLNQGQSSSSMLLKMAFIQEGLGDYSGALYYLNLNYLKTSSKRVLLKMEELAKKHNLVGYEYTDYDYFLSFYYKYQLQVTLAILSLVLFMFAFIYYKKRSTQRRPVLAGVFYVLLLGLLYVLVNYGSEYQKGIIMSPNAYLMQAPSSGADLLEVVKKGHRVRIVGKEDVWVKINWNGNTAYVRENNIRPINI